MKNLRQFRFISATRASEILGISRSALHKLLKSGQLKHYRVGGLIRIDERDLEDFLQSAETGGQLV